ncbi:murein L,D-transpeptidase catalytic domain-containing protein [Flaviaesturariibacter aridisoli]|uniref:Peptidase n=1 Tax=Flaviaesturariibacter aridisoli TaxID=2545761 RepID=A0A4R4E7D2_9BACT|nr:murein L,D-transpeptidase catalytic domain family protein [Flaviaesturariibacter aridisoli]TCZ73625.1 peptidase [Flaviaesturariibacter aridisoli]
MAKTLTACCLLLALTAAALYLRGRKSGAAALPEPATAIPAAPPRPAESAPERSALRARLHAQGLSGQVYAAAHGLSTRIAFLVDMSRHSGRRRFFIYDLRADSILSAGLVAHGSCNTDGLADAAFGNEPGCGCTSLGRYKVGYAYRGRFGTAFKLYGLDPGNSNAFRRYVVLHAYDCVPDEERYPVNICNSLGCPMVSYPFLDTATTYIRREKKPILLWIYK